jgi:GNAT superfamily N-acetyltransferase
VIEVRPVRAHEHTKVGDLTVAAYDAVGRVSDDYRCSLRDVAGRSSPESHVLVAVDGGAVVGSVTIVSAASEHFEHGRHGDGGFRMLAVVPEAQGRGVGRVLLDAALEHAHTAQWRRLVITTMEWMPAARAMYEAAGFVRRPDLDVRFSSGVGLCYQLDLSDDAARHFPAPGPVPDDPPVFVPREDRPPGC